MLMARGKKVFDPVLNLKLFLQQNDCFWQHGGERIGVLGLLEVNSHNTISTFDNLAKEDLYFWEKGKRLMTVF